MSLNVQPGFRAAEVVKSTSAPIQGKTSPTNAAKAKGGAEFSFWDLIDIVNPLQHIPVVNTIYRAVTGDKISNFSRIAGGAVFGGVAGAALGIVNSIAVEESGKDVAQLALNKVGIHIADDKPETEIADAGEADKEIPVVEVRPLAQTKELAPQAAENAAAMPPVKNLNDINPVAGFSQSVDPNQIPTAMMDALLKYQELKNNPEAEESKHVASVENEEEKQQSLRLRDHLSADRLIVNR